MSEKSVKIDPGNEEEPQSQVPPFSEWLRRSERANLGVLPRHLGDYVVDLPHPVPRGVRREEEDQFNMHGFPAWPPVPVFRRGQDLGQMSQPVSEFVSRQNSPVPNQNLIQLSGEDVAVTSASNVITSTTVVSGGLQMRRTTDNSTWMRRGDEQEDDDDYSSVSTEYPEDIGTVKGELESETGFGHPQFHSTPFTYSGAGGFRRPPPQQLINPFEEQQELWRQPPPPYSPTNPFAGPRLPRVSPGGNVYPVAPAPATPVNPVVVSPGIQVVRTPPPIPPRRSAPSPPVRPPIPPRLGVRLQLQPQQMQFSIPVQPQQQQQFSIPVQPQQQQQYAQAPPRFQQPPPPPPPQTQSFNANDFVEAMSRLLVQTGNNNLYMRTRTGKESELPRFNGDPIQWPYFYFRYCQSSAEGGYTPTENVNRLKKCLDDPALSEVQSLFLAQNADQAIIYRLWERFGKPQIVVNRLISKARETPAAKEGDLEALMKLAAAVSNLVTTVQSLGVSKYLTNPTLLEELVRKLPGSLRLDWGRFMRPHSSPTLLEFAEWIESYSAAASNVTTVAFPSSSSENKKDDKKKDKKGKKGNSESVHANTEKEEGSKTTPKCVKCSGEHWLQKCSEFQKLDSSARWNFAREKKLCYNCFRTTHTVGEKKCKGICGTKYVDKDGKEQTCKRRHQRLLHTDPKKEDAPAVAPKKEEKDVKEVVATLQGGPSSLLKIVPVKVSGPLGDAIVNVLLDDGSTVSLMSSNLAKRIGCKGKAAALRLNFTDASGMEDLSSRRISCQVRGIKEDKSFRLDEVRTVSDLVLPKPTYMFGNIVKTLPYLKGTSFMYLDAPAEMLIGAPHSHLILNREVKEGQPGQPIASRTKLGWVLHGPLGKPLEKEALFNCSHEEIDDITHQLVKESYAIDAIGIVNRKSLRSKEDEAAEKQIEQVTRRVGQRWETGLLWKQVPGSSELPKLPSSYAMAHKRFISLEKKFARDPEFKAEYVAKINDQLAKGYIRKLTPAEAAQEEPCTWYLPHFATYHPNKPKKIRVVYDFAARSGGKCLNDFLRTGADLLPNLVGIVIQFRQWEVAYCGDIVEMFPQVRIRSEDCPAQRLLFREDPSKPIEVMQSDVMQFGSVCAPFAAQHIRNKNADEFKEEYPEAAEVIKKKHYMDDLVKSSKKVDEAEKLIHDVKFVHAQGGFDIGKWISNSEELLKSICGDNESSNDKDLTAWSENPVERALGLHWIPREDVFVFKLNLQRAGEKIASGEQVPTKREILRLIMLIWDPLGFLSHYLVKARILIQHIWRMKLGWDDEIPEELMKTWTSWIRRLPEVRNIKIPRMYSPGLSRADDVQLHVFADASEVAYSCVAYLRIKYGDNVDVAFVMAKCRVAPLKPATIPRLELQAALMAARIGIMIQEEVEFPISRVCYWTDSTTVLKWIRAEARRYTQFVANRIGELQEVTDVSSWRWVPSRENPADDATREGSTDLSPDARFWKGPAFLKGEEDTWPQERNCRQENNDGDEELRSEFVHVVVEAPEFSLPDLDRFSKWTRIVGAATEVLLIAKLWRKHPLPDYLVLKQKAELLLICRSQWEEYPEEMQLLTNQKPIKRNSRLFQLNPFLDDDGVLRMKSRLATHPEIGIRTPIILSPKNRLVELLIQHYHEKFAHHGENFVRNELRQTYWITNARAAIKKQIRHCFVCKKRNLKPEEPMMGDMPDFRIQPQPRPFTVVGMDFVGPLTVTVKRSTEKRYGALFVCMSTRAVHLEIAHSLSTDSAIMAIRRFIGRRGQPREIVCDNGTNLKGSERELREEIAKMNAARVEHAMEVKGIRWRFIPPRSPHMGGSYERLVRSVKIALGAILKTYAPKDEILLTLIAEAEAIVNSRPLLEVPLDPDAPEALTPFHFLIGTSSSQQPPGLFDDDDLLLSKKWKHAQVLANHFWRRWMREYVPTLQQRKKWHEPVPKLAIGDLVVVFDESLPRGSFPLGVVMAIKEGTVDQVRIADVKIVTELDGDPTHLAKTKVYQRPAVKLGRLGVRGFTIDKADGFPPATEENGGEYSVDCDEEAEE